MHDIDSNRTSYIRVIYARTTFFHKRNNSIRRMHSMDEHPIQGLMTSAMETLKDMIEVNTISGDPVESPDGSVIIPVSKVGFGFAAGGSEFNSNQSQDDSGEATLPFGGGSGGGVSMTPVAF